MLFSLIELKIISLIKFCLVLFTVFAFLIREVDHSSLLKGFCQKIIGLISWQFQSKDSFGADRRVEYGHRGFNSFVL